MGPIANWILRIATGLSVWGVYEFNTNDVGKSASQHCFWVFAEVRLILSRIDRARQACLDRLGWISEKESGNGSRVSVLPHAIIAV
jgi:hypothetical protein